MRIYILMFLLLVVGCKKSSTGPTVYQNVSGVMNSPGGCSGWLIKREDDRTILEPFNLDSFQVTLKSGQPVLFSYTLKNIGDICLGGQPIELISIKDQ